MASVMTVNTIYKIGDLAREFNVTLRTLRFYEDKGLVQPARSGTTRLYTKQDRNRLSLILFCKRIGLSLEEIRRITELHEGIDRDKKQILDVFLSQLQALKQQQSETRAIIDALQVRIDELKDQCA